MNKVSLASGWSEKHGNFNCEFYYCYVDKISHELYMKCLNWCTDNLGQRWNHSDNIEGRWTVLFRTKPDRPQRMDDTAPGYMWYFKSEEDLVWFKLSCL